MPAEHTPVQFFKREPLSKAPEQKPLSLYESYGYATTLLTERKSHNNEVTSYRPYFYTVEGKNGQHDIASRYASVEANGGKAWFEILQDTPEVPVTEISFITAHPLDTILNNAQSPDAKKISDQIDQPQPGNSIVRFVSFDEVPLIDGYPRITEPQELLAAYQKMVEHLLTENQQPLNPTKLAVPTLEQLEMFSSEQLEFSPLYASTDGTIIGKGRTIEANIGENETHDIFIYPVRTTDEDGLAKNTYLISTEEINPDAKTNHTGLIGREDSICGCEKFGTHALNHSCGHEILGSLQKQSRGNVPVVIAWDPAADCNGNGSVMHSLKGKNLQKLPQTQNDLIPFGAMYEQDIALTDRRDFKALAQSLTAATEFFDSSIFILQTTNSQKIAAMDLQLNRLQGKVYLTADPHEKRVVPESVKDIERLNGERPHKYTERQRRDSLQAN